MGNISLQYAGQISGLFEVGAGSRITASGAGSIQYTASSLTDARNGVATWQAWPKGSSSGFCDALRRVVIRAAATGAYDVQIDETKRDEGPEGVSWQEDFVTASTDPVTGGVSLVAGGVVVPVPRARQQAALYFNRFLSERPCTKTFANIASYTRGGISLDVTTTAGSNQITWVSGNPVADVGAAAWMGVIYQNGRYSTVIISSTSGNILTASDDMTLTGSAVLSSYHESLNGVHLSPFGGKALADMLFYCDPLSLVGDTQANYDVDIVQGAWYATPWITPFNSPQFWKQTGGLPNNQIGLGAGYIANPFNSDNVFSADANSATTANAAGIGQGIILSLPITGAGVASFSCGHLSVTSRRFSIVVAVDGVAVFSGTQSAAIKGYKVAFPTGAVLTITLAASSADATALVANRVSVSYMPFGLRRSIEQGDKVMVIGDSWTETASRPEFVDQLRLRAEAIGASVLPSYGVGGTRASDALTVVGGVRNIDAWITASARPTVCIIHYYLNEYVGGVIARQWAANMTEIVRTCISAGITPVVMLPGCTGSQSQTKSLIADYGRALGVPVCSSDSITESLLPELQDKACFINTVRKRAGRAVHVSSIPATYVARSSVNTSIWDCITAGATPATVTPV